MSHIKRATLLTNMPFKSYDKIHRYGKEEVEGILEGECFIQEKIDGANTQIWMENGELKMGSRNQEITEGFNGFCDYVRNHQGIKDLLTKYPRATLYGEWLVRHTIGYNELSYKQWYMFDVHYQESDQWLCSDDVDLLAMKFGIKTPKLFMIATNPSLDMVQTFVGQSVLGQKGEGVVIKNLGFRNKFGECCYAKIVTEKFKEDNAVTFGGNNKHSESYWELYVVNKYMTLGRVEKIMHKIEPTIEGKLDMCHIPRIIQTAYHDLITEEIWDIQAKVPVLDFKTLSRLAQKKARQIYIELLTGDISVAHQKNDQEISNS